MNPYDHHDYRRDIEKIDARRREAAAERRSALQRKLPEPEAMPGDRRWQGGFLLRFSFQLAFWSWLIWWLLGMPQIPIKWLQ